jgi:hypothetical protein
MEEQKRMEYGFQGYKPPPLPRAMRSARARAGGWHKKKNYIDNGGVCFELLATVAGQLLQEKETEKISSELEGILTTGMRQKVQDIWEGEVENSPEQALLDLHNSQHASRSVGASEVTLGNTTQQLAFEDSHYKGCSHENAMASSVVHKKLSFLDPTKNEDADLSQSISRSTSIIGKSGSANQSSDRKRDLELLSDSQVTNERCMVVPSEEGERSTRSNEKEKECICTDSYGEGNLLCGQSLLHPSQDADSKEKLVKGSMGPQEDHEGRGENDVNEISSVHQQRKETAYVRTEDEAVLDVHTSLVSLTSNAGVSIVAGLNSHELGSSVSTEKGPHCIENKPCDSSMNGLKDMINIFRDDDDNSSDITNPSTVTNKLWKTLPAKGTKFGRSISSKYRIIASTRKRNYSKMVVNTDGTVHTESPGSGLRWKRQRTVRYPTIKRKMLAAGFSTSDINANTSCTVLDVNALDIEHYDSPTKPCSAKSGSIPSPGSAPVSSSQKAVKLGIKSFTVPELFIEVPESATVANLKKAATEAVINLLEGGFQVRILLQGMKVTDENATLIQVGASHPEKLETVGFMLEPNSIPSSSTGADDPLFMLSHAASRTSSTYPKASCSGTSIDIEVNKGLIDGSCSETNGMFSADVAQMAGCQTQVDINQWVMSESDLIMSSSHPQAVSYSGALVVHPSVDDSNQGLTLVPVRHRSRRADIGKRRLRRPFTVAEVEVLVQAVEKLGTGRWREIKLHAFDHAKHRTYVDLKDKWKTLVHTATIAPHQRRGEPVPLELLDRVIRAHSYWTKRQTNQMVNHSL